MPPSAYDTWAAGRADGRFSEWLREEAEPSWSEAASHRFTRELADGTLADEVMRRYLVQDYAFLDSFVRLVASAIVKAPSLADRVPLGRFLGAVTGEQNTYFQRAFDALVLLCHKRLPILGA
jgi:thiaminase (transcriptional activator TenA)